MHACLHVWSCVDWTAVELLVPARVGRAAVPGLCERQQSLCERQERRATRRAIPVAESTNHGAPNASSQKTKPQQTSTNTHPHAHPHTSHVTSHKSAPCGRRIAHLSPPDVGPFLSCTWLPIDLILGATEKTLARKHVRVSLCCCMYCQGGLGPVAQLQCRSR